MRANCFTSDTKVTTSFGDIEIGSITEGIKVMTRQGFRRVTRHVMIGDRKVHKYHIAFEDKEGIDVVCTETQRFKTDMGDVPIKYIAEGMYLYRRDIGDFMKVLFIGSEFVGYDFCYDIEVADEHEYYANGLLVKSI